MNRLSGDGAEDRGTPGSSAEGLFWWLGGQSACVLVFLGMSVGWMMFGLKEKTEHCPVSAI